MPGSLAARDISKSYAAVQVLDRVSLVVSPGDRDRHRRPERDRQVDPAAGARGARAARPRPDRPRRRRRLPAAGAGGARRRDGARLPGAPHRRRRRRARDGRARGAARRRAGARRRLLRRARPLPRARRRGLRGARSAPSSPTSGSAARPSARSTSLSGGEAARAALAAILLARFDVFLLDEPTNNLDFAGLDAARAVPRRLAAGVVLVSHDRAFLDRSVTRVVEIEAETRSVHEYAGTWTEYEAARERARAQHERDYADYVGERSRYTELLRVAARGRRTCSAASASSHARRAAPTAGRRTPSAAR